MQGELGCGVDEAMGNGAEKDRRNGYPQEIRSIGFRLARTLR